LTHISVYVDESGDVGFKQKSSEFFTIGYVFTIDRFPTKENKKIATLLKNINIGIRKHRKKIPEFKFSCNTDRVKQKVLREINKLDVNIGVICISKDSVQSHLKEDSSMFYRYVVVENVITTLVSKYVKSYDHYTSIRFVIDRSLSKQQIKSFNEYCETKMSIRSHQLSSVLDLRPTILHEDSKTVPMLQVADYVASATQRKITHCDSTYFDIIADKIKHRKTWDWNNKIDFGDS